MRSRNTLWHPLFALCDKPRPKYTILNMIFIYLEFSNPVKGPSVCLHHIHLRVKKYRSKSVYRWFQYDWFNYILKVSSLNIKSPRIVGLHKALPTVKEVKNLTTHAFFKCRCLPRYILSCASWTHPQMLLR